MRIAHRSPIKALVTASKTTTAEAPVIRLTDTAARVGNGKKLELLGHSTSSSDVFIETLIAATGKPYVALMRN
ncbi:hypothetical protein OS42_14120 [Dickeya oryzae]